MKTLFIDTSSNTLSVALLLNDEIECIREINSINEHSKYTINEINEILKYTKTNPKDIKKVMVINGPGSFTGLRIGVAVAKTFGWSLNINVIPISTLKAYALSNVGYDYYISLIDARREHVYALILDKDYNNCIDEKYMSINELNDNINKLSGTKLIIGDIKIKDTLKHVNPILDIKKIYDFYKSKEGINAHKLVPNYLKKVEAEEKLGSEING